MNDDRKVRIPRILLLGCGRMGGSLLSRWLSTDLISVSDMLVVEPDSSALKNIEKSRRPRQVKSIADIEALKEPVCVVLAVKPQQFEHVVAFLAGLPCGSIVLSVALPLICRAGHCWPRCLPRPWKGRPERWRKRRFRTSRSPVVDELIAKLSRARHLRSPASQSSKRTEPSRGLLPGVRE
jgi:hypothetical protein